MDLVEEQAITIITTEEMQQGEATNSTMLNTINIENTNAEVYDIEKGVARVFGVGVRSEK